MVQKPLKRFGMVTTAYSHTGKTELRPPASSQRPETRAVSPLEQSRGGQESYRESDGDRRKLNSHRSRDDSNTSTARRATPGREKRRRRSDSQGNDRGRTRDRDHSRHSDHQRRKRRRGESEEGTPSRSSRLRRPPRPKSPQARPTMEAVDPGTTRGMDRPIDTRPAGTESGAITPRVQPSAAPSPSLACLCIPLPSPPRKSR